MASLACERTIAAPIAVVWTVLTDHRAFAVWGAVEKVTLEREGSPDANGVGAIRRIENGRLKVREEIVEFSPMQRLRYTVLSGPPVRDYFGEVVLTGGGGSTHVRWSIDFEPKIFGTAFVMKPVIGRVIRQMLDKAKAEAEKRARTAG